jgi:dolichyl-phosphate-mannose-protein mannosyltransferase
MLLFATCLATYALCVFYNHQRTSPLSVKWFKWMCITGLSLGIVASMKWVGLFAIALVGLHTLEELWEMFGDLKMPVVPFY